MLTSLFIDCKVCWEMYQSLWGGFWVGLRGVEWGGVKGIVGNAKRAIYESVTSIKTKHLSFKSLKIWGIKMLKSSVFIACVASVLVRSSRARHT